MIQDITPEMITAQMDAVFSDITVDAVKVGMISRSPSIRAIAQGLRKWKPAIVVIDPVMVAKSGSPLLQQEACDTLIRELLPLATLVTPNLPEAETLCGFAGRTEDDMMAAARHIVGLGAKAVMVKGSRLTSEESNDYLFEDTVHLASRHTHRHDQHAWDRMHLIERPGRQPGQRPFP